MTLKKINALMCTLALSTAAYAQETGQSGSFGQKPDANGFGQVPEKLTVDTAPSQNAIALQCTFATECFEGEACTDTTFEMEVSGRAGGLVETDMVVEANLVSVNGTTPVLGVRSGTAMSLSGGTFDARELLTIATGGDARYSLHYVEGPLVISYLGSCS
ncbi:hypothetical protein [Planktotalea sp.]|uniref:hypothetical protein n=1 Tax=Planktotalea sp. TaxID=2029877 RepID=UPI0032969CEE